MQVRMNELVMRKEQSHGVSEMLRQAVRSNDEARDTLVDPSPALWVKLVQAQKYSACAIASQHSLRQQHKPALRMSARSVYLIV